MTSPMPGLSLIELSPGPALLVGAASGVIHQRPRVEFQIQGRGDRINVALRGTLDLAGVRLLNDVIDVVQASTQPFTVDCDGLSSIDGAGVTALLLAAGRGASIERIHGPFGRLFQVLGLTTSSQHHHLT